MAAEWIAGARSATFGRSRRQRHDARGMGAPRALDIHALRPSRFAEGGPTAGSALP